MSTPVSEPSRNAQVCLLIPAALCEGDKARGPWLDHGEMLWGVVCLDDWETTAVYLGPVVGSDGRDYEKVFVGSGCLHRPGGDRLGPLQLVPRGRMFVSRALASEARSGACSAGPAVAWTPRSSPSPPSPSVMDADSTLSCCPCRARAVRGVVSGVPSGGGDPAGDAKGSDVVFGSPWLRVFATEEAARVFEDLRVRWSVFWHGPVHGFVFPRDDPESPAFCGAYDAFKRSSLHTADVKKVWARGCEPEEVREHVGKLRVRRV